MGWLSGKKSEVGPADLAGLLRTDHAQWAALLEELEGQLTVNRAAARAYHDTLSRQLRGHLTRIELSLVEPTLAAQAESTTRAIARWRGTARATRDALGSWELPLGRGEPVNPRLAEQFRETVRDHERVECEELLPAVEPVIGPERIRALRMEWGRRPAGES
ncbi:MAG: hypothetical protein L3K03_05575 [Thermoplasmata archaeon]|nr:hypothetical protein [Thermoplasmata archaeon]